MRLIDLEPRWYSEHGRQGQGLTFQCPACRETRLGVALANPVDGGAPMPLAYRGNEGRLWERAAGTTFEDLSLTPSIDASVVKRHDGESDERFAERCRQCTARGEAHWHGHITAGAIQ